MNYEPPDYPLFRSFVDGQLTEPFYIQYVRFNPSEHKAPSAHGVA